MWPNKADYLQLIIIAIVFGSALLQFLYRTFFKSMPRGPARGGDGAGEPASRPAKTFRDFLEEIRQEARRAQGQETEGRPAPEPQPAVPPRQPAVPPRQPAPAPEVRRGPRPQRRDEPVAAEVRPPPARPVDAEPEGEIEPESVHRYLEELARGAEGLAHLETHIGEEAAPSSTVVAVTGVEVASQALRRGPRAVPLPALGVGLREAILAQVILAPPRSLSRRRRPLV